MPVPIPRYALDLTGESPNNLVEGEVHNLGSGRRRAIATKYGAYFADSLVVREVASGRVLTRNTHYVGIELHPQAVYSTGKEVFGAVLIVDPGVSSPVSINYQALGGFYEDSSQTLVTLLNKTSDTGLELSFYDTTGRPETYNPQPHFHAIGEAVGFEQLVFALDRIRNAILWVDSFNIQSILNYVNNLVNDIDARMRNTIDGYVGDQLQTFRRTINAAYIGLDKVANLENATAEEGRQAGRVTTQIGDFLKAKHVTLEAIVAFKNQLHETFVSSENTNLGKLYGVIAAPNKQTLLNMRNGSVLNFLSRQDAVANNVAFEINAYPTGSPDDVAFTYMKITNNPNNRGGIYLAYAETGALGYMGVHATGRVTDAFIWRRFAYTEDLTQLTTLIASHISNTANPHKTKASQINLGNVENLPVVTRLDVLSLNSVRKYVTFDALLLFMKTFMVGQNGGEADPNNPDNLPIELCQIIYCPINKCGCDEPEPEPEPNPPEPVPPPPAPPSAAVSITGFEASVSVGGTLVWNITNGPINSAVTVVYTIHEKTGSVGTVAKPPITEVIYTNGLGQATGTRSVGSVEGYIEGLFSFAGSGNTISRFTNIVAGSSAPTPAPTPTPTQDQYTTGYISFTRSNGASLPMTIRHFAPTGLILAEGSWEELRTIQTGYGLYFELNEVDPTSPTSQFKRIQVSTSSIRVLPKASIDSRYVSFDINTYLVDSGFTLGQFTSITKLIIIPIPAPPAPPPSGPVNPSEGTLKLSTCQGFDFVDIYHDGQGGTYTVVRVKNSELCGYSPPAPPPPPAPPASSDLTKQIAYTNGAGVTRVVSATRQSSDGVVYINERLTDLDLSFSASWAFLTSGNTIPIPRLLIQLSQTKTILIPLNMAQWNGLTSLFKDNTAPGVYA